MTAAGDVVRPSLRQYAAPEAVRGAVLMLHGGKEAGHEVVDGRSASWRRSAAMARAISPTAQKSQIAVFLLRFRHRGWNDGTGPVADATWALEQLHDQVGDISITLLGHSMGARVAARVAGEPRVRGVIALAPWFPPGEPLEALAGKQLVAAHGSRDRITSARATRSYVERARGAGAEATFVDMGSVGHYLLRGVRAWNELALRTSLELLKD